MASFNFRQKVNVPVVTTKRSSTVRRVDTKEALRFDLNELEDYAASKKSHSMSRKTVKNWIAIIKAIFNRMGYIEYSQDYVREVRHRLESEKDRPTATINLYLFALQELFRANYDPAFKIIRPKVTVDLTDDEGKYHTPEEVQILFEHIGKDNVFGVRNRAILALLYFAALRNSELVHLTCGDYDVENKFVVVRAHGQWHPKSYQARKINVPDVCNKYVKAWLDLRSEMGIGCDSNSPLVLGGNGENGALTEIGLYQLLYRTSKAVGLKTYPHKLRHSRCSHLGNGINGSKPWNVAVLCKFMGHSSIEVTNRYIHTNDSDQKYCLANTNEIEI